jgi:hypothetical protein
MKDIVVEGVGEILRQQELRNVLINDVVTEKVRVVENE